MTTNATPITDEFVSELAEMLDDTPENAGKTPEDIEDDVVDDVIDEDAVEDEAKDDEDAVEDVEETLAASEDVVDEDAYTIASLAEAIEIDQKELYDVVIPMDGDTEAMSIGAMKNEYQTMVRDKTTMEDTIKQQTDQLSQFEAGTTPQQQLSQQEIQARVAVESIVNEFNSVDWVDLDEFSPGESALKRQQLQTRFNEAQNGVFAAQQQQQANYEHFLGEQNSKLMEMVPEWKDSEQRSKDYKEISKVLQDSGYSEEDVGRIADPVAMKLLHRLVTLEKQAAQQKVVLKTVRKSPKPLPAKDGVTQPKNSKRNNKFEAAKHGNIDQKVDAIMEFL